MSVAAAIILMVEEDGLTYEQAVRAAARMESALSGGKSGGHQVDMTAENRRAWDRERKAKDRAERALSGGNPVEVPNGAYKEPTSSASTDKLEDLGTARTRKPSTRGTRLPMDWQPSPADIEFAQSHGMTIEAIRRELAKYRDYWAAKAGAGGVKLDWSATWRNWIRNNSSPPKDHGNERSRDISAAFDRLEASIVGREDHEPEEPKRRGDSDDFGGRLQLIARSDF